jgi:hypothetical protein
MSDYRRRANCFIYQAPHRDALRLFVLFATFFAAFFFPTPLLPADDLVFFATRRLAAFGSTFFFAAELALFVLPDFVFEIFFRVA